MIRAWKLNNSTYMIEYRGQLKRVRDKYWNMRKRRGRGLISLRYAINKATRLNTCQYRHVRNVRISGQWISEWVVI